MSEPATETRWVDFTPCKTAEIVEPDACNAAAALSKIGLVLEQGIDYELRPNGTRIASCVPRYRTRLERSAPLGEG